MIVVAIIGVLAAIAVPSLTRAQLKAKRAELPANMKGIMVAELAYDASYGGFLDTSYAPGNPGSEGKRLVTWTASRSDSRYTNWNTINFRPDGLVRGIYRVRCIGGSNNHRCTLDALSDVDGDGVEARYTATWDSTMSAFPNQGPTLSTAANVY